jgi:hypothetical protein
MHQEKPYLSPRPQGVCLLQPLRNQHCSLSLMGQWRLIPELRKQQRSPLTQRWRGHDVRDIVFRSASALRRLFVPDSLLIISHFLQPAHTEAPQIKHLLELSKRGCRMKWLFAWLILNAVVFVWRVLVVWPQLKAKDQSVSVDGASFDHARTRASHIQATARVVGHGVV